MARLGRIDEDGGQGHVGAGVDVLLQHQFVVHLVDVVAGEDEDVLRLLAADGVDVLIDGVGGALVPILADALHRREDFDELAKFAGRPPSSLADMAIERERLVLRKDINLAQVGVDAVGERDIDDAVDSAERNGGLGAVTGEWIQAFAGAAGQQNSQCVLHLQFPRCSGLD